MLQMSEEKDQGLPEQQHTYHKDRSSFTISLRARTRSARILRVCILPSHESKTASRNTKIDSLLYGLRMIADSENTPDNGLQAG